MSFPELTLKYFLKVPFSTAKGKFMTMTVLFFISLHPTFPGVIKGVFVDVEEQRSNLCWTVFDKSNNFHPSSQLQIGELKMILHGTISKDDLQRNTALQCWNNVVTIRNNVATMLQRCVAIKIFVANCFVWHHLSTNEFFKRRTSTRNEAF